MHKKKSLNSHGVYLHPLTRDELPMSQPVVHAAWSRYGREDMVLRPVIFKGPDGTEWHVPAGVIVNGLSTPQGAWMFSPPYQGKAREASVLHDRYCGACRIGETHMLEHDSPKVHAMFYYAMRANGVGWWRAYTRWLCVRIFGPRFKAGKVFSG
jgi:hypothetical protein